MASMIDAAGFIHGEMIKNLDHKIAKQIRELNKVTWVDVVIPAKQMKEVISAMRIWKSMVGNRRPWDHKGVLKAQFGEWTFDANTKREFFFDIWSNIHYGYLGGSVGFGAWLLKAGAGFAQWNAGTNPPGYWKRRIEDMGDADFLAAFDDPKDQIAIVLGTYLWGSKKEKLTLGELVAAVRAAAAELSTR